MHEMLRTVDPGRAEEDGLTLMAEGLGCKRQEANARIRKKEAVQVLPLPLPLTLTLTLTLPLPLPLPLPLTLTADRAAPALTSTHPDRNRTPGPRTPS